MGALALQDLGVQAFAVWVFQFIILVSGSLV